MKKSLLTVLPFFSCLFTVLSSFAQINALCIEGSVTRIDDPKQLLTDIVSLEDSFTGTIRYDMSLTDDNPLDQVADYRNTSSLTGIRIQIGNQVFETNPNHVNFLVETVDNYYNHDNIVFRSYNNIFTPVIPGINNTSHISWQLDDPSQTALSSVALPSSIHLTDWQQPFALTITGSNHSRDSSIFLRAIVTSVNSCANEHTATSISPVHTKDPLNVYPNPYHDSATLKFDSFLHQGAVNVYNMQGEKMISFDQVSGNTFTIPRGNLPSGAYIIQLINDDLYASIAKVIITDKQ